MKAMVQNRRLGKEGTLTAEDHKIEMVRSFKYLGTVINDINDKTKRSGLGSWRPIKPIAPYKPHSNLNKSIETIK